MKQAIKKSVIVKTILLSSLILGLSFGFVFINNDTIKAEKSSKNLKHFTLQQEGVIPIEIERSGSPWIKLKQGEPINSDFVGTDSAINQFESGALKPTALASTDFNFDGYNDLLSGFAGTNGGIITLHRGNSEAFAPTDPQVLAGIRSGQFPVSFERETKVIEVPISPDFIVTGNFVKNSSLDLIVASRNSSSIYLFSSDRKGGFGAPQEILVNGDVSALAADRFDVSKAFSGLTVATKNDGGELLVYNGQSEIKGGKPQRVSIGKEVSSLILASADGTTSDRDLFILADGDILRIPQIGKQIQTPTRLELPYRVNEFAIGEFIRDRRAKAEIAVLAENGSIYYLQNGSLDTRPFTEKEMRAEFAKNGRGRSVLTDSTDQQSSLADNWTVAEEHNLGIYEFNKQNSQSLLQKSYITGNSTEDLLITNPSNGKVQVIFKEPVYEANASAFTGNTLIENVGFANSPVAALPIRLNVMGQQGIVVLESGKLEPTPIMLAPNANFTVSKIVDTNDGACDGDCSLREAVVAANNAAGADLITFTPNGSHQLAISSPGEDAAAGGDLDITQSLTITGNGSANTFLQGGASAATGIDKVLSINPAFTSAFATSISGVTVRFGNNPTSYATDGFGGAFDWEGSGTGTLTVANTVVNDNRTLDGDGGGIAITNSSAGTGNTSFTNVTVSNNVPARAGGVAVFGGGMFVGTTTKFALSGTAFTSNSLGANANSQGGGILALGPSSAAAGISTITNATFTTNTSPNDGGGIYSTQPLTFTSPITFTGNSSGRFGGGLFISSGAATSSVSEASFVNNSATTQGGGVFNNTGTLNLNFSRFTGNTGGGFNGLAVAAGTASVENNWWSCNTGPAAAPCNTAGVTGGTIDFNPWLQLRISVGSASLVTGQTSTLTASFLQNSDGAAVAASNLDALIGLPVTFGGTGATITSAQATIQANGTATATFSAPAIGAKTGTATVDSGTASVSITVAKANTTTVINTANLAPNAASVVGQPIVVTYSVPVTAPGGGTPTGNVTVTDGTASCTGTVAAGQCTITFTSAGTKTLTATYAGDANYNGSASPGFSQVVNKANTAPAITGQSSTSTPQGQSFTVNYSVPVVAPGAGSPTGNVTVSDGVQSCTGTVAAGQCQLLLTTLGPRTLVATYSGDANFNTGTSPGVTHTVLPITAASASISGRVLTASNEGVTRAIVSVISPSGTIYNATTNSFGYFRIEGLPTGATYVLSVNRKGYQFSQQTISLNEDVIDLTINAFE